MQRWRGYDAAPGGWGRSVVTIGVFDGVHKGHQATIGHAVARAREIGVKSVVVTFDPHPAEVVRPGSHPAVLTEPTRKAELIEALGVDVLCVLPFTPEFSRLPAEAFVHDVLVEHLHAALVVVGENFRFGHRAAGDVALLERLGRTFGYAVEGAPLVAEAGTVFSSTYIRSCVAAGDVVAAARALGRPHRLEGVVVRGDQRGRELGFPTANLLCHRYAAVPADGVYAARLVRRGQREPLMAAVSIGTNPSFSGRERRVEAYVLDFDADLYGERLALDFVAHLRGQVRYDSVEPLVAQIAEDVERTRQALG
ncbi:bifunctional riboflavin kinase/FAD synthetase [Salinispora arenicola]|uniref:Riboflavin biosynthesis protein n=1 Tax=Salinispora arenicola (strain CNS-205) TaxID=391037 RepID=A8M756_SALAI|nr:bifunctional riboflavin kinase/FAD synthetase [Salinispora arenicola]MCN0180734.1 bifunctional riboflavin kinase/FAD synthetase [Salinispora arenicola]NIL42660.1 bifunctional riboflavin kinase/FAD synthetase [Salinispora arenicola]NIL59838.1 bifunctional riboflavin kinase/FAD synthetase [Salinispora arenicola]NIL63345.1 bifunctional riboflavin kinase/FAD synthetase [Salinispora arenicola]